MHSGSYDHREIEPRWQAEWRERRAFEPEEPGGEPCPGRRDFYVATAPPFTSGNVHLGHVRSYALGDAVARYRRLRGDNVLYATGFDAFGLPVEIAAIERGIPPADWVERCIVSMRSEFDRFGFSFAWSRAYTTSDPSCYRWTQWVFLWLLERGLIYRAEAPVDWCPACRSVLAKLQVENGRCWRCDTPTEIRVRHAWFVRISSYLEQLWDELPGGDPRRRWLQGQRNLLGRIEGVEVQLDVDGHPLTAFTRHADRAGGAALVAVAPGDPLLQRLADDGVRRALAALGDAGGERATGRVALVDTGLRARFADGRALPVIATPYADAACGGDAVLVIPGESSAEAELAARAGAPAGDGAPVEERSAVRFRQRDVSISRQRSWGAPIPVVDCPGCGPVPVAEAELPVVLPTDLVPTGEGNALASCDAFVETTCPRCAGPARRETDTIDCWFDSVWFLAACTVPEGPRRERLFEDPELRRWLPVALEVCGVDIPPNQMGFRFLAKAGRAHGLLGSLPGAEPIADTLMHEMILAGGRKMSKHLGNAVVPAELVEALGADAVRLAVLSAAAPAKTLRWTGDELPRRSRAFLDALFTFVAARAGQLPASPGPGAEIEPSTKPRRRLSRWLERAVERTHAAYGRHDFHQVAQNLRRLFESLERFEREARAAGEWGTHDQAAIAVVLRHLLLLLSPLAPHLAEELWSRTGGEGLLAEARLEGVPEPAR
ncbi:MAG: class I tRNA ligase family protein [Planctomycetota bacterium]